MVLLTQGTRTPIIADKFGELDNPLLNFRNMNSAQFIATG